uniref:Golgi associated RAB2 interactor protein-like Rab2B-binding domain-containing protein n=1 Tax=Falco tinnunculus TaxID=100819 RepID=A0A8C4VBP4_FALTI
RYPVIWVTQKPVISSPPLSLFNFSFLFIHTHSCFITYYPLPSPIQYINFRGEPISVHKRASCVTIGICAANPSSPMPSAMLVASEVPLSPQESIASFWKLSEQPSHMEQLILTRLLPLKFVELSVHSTDKHHLMLKLVNGRSYYLELCAPPDQQRHLFHLWLQLISLLKSPGNTGNTKVSVKCKEICMSPIFYLAMGSREKEQFCVHITEKLQGSYKNIILERGENCERLFFQEKALMR